MYFNGSRAGPTSPVLKTTVAKGVTRDECNAKWDPFDKKSTVFRDIPRLIEGQACVGDTPGAACFVSGLSTGSLHRTAPHGRTTLIDPSSCHFSSIWCRMLNLSCSADGNITAAKRWLAAVLMASGFRQNQTALSLAVVPGRSWRNLDYYRFQLSGDLFFSDIP